MLYTNMVFYSDAVSDNAFMLNNSPSKCLLDTMTILNITKWQNSCSRAVGWYMRISPFPLHTMLQFDK